MSNTKIKYFNWKAFVFMILGLTTTLLLAYLTKYNIEKQAINKFHLVCNDLKARIEARLFAHEQLLYSGSAFFNASDSVSRNDWQNFYEKLETKEKLPGIQGVGFSIVIKPSDLNNHIKHIQDEGFKDYTVIPAGKRDIYTSIIYIEPFIGRNLKAFGYDMYSDPIRKKAMDLAMENNYAALTGKVILVQEDTFNVQTGTLMYVPVYRKNLPHNTVKERKENIIGWVYSPYRMNDLMDGVLGSWNELIQERIHLRIFAGAKIDENNLLYDSQLNEELNHACPITNQLQIKFNGNDWTLVFGRRGGFSFYWNSKVIIVLICGFAISLLIYFLTLSIYNTRVKAIGIAKKLTNDLFKSEARFKNIIASHSSIMWMLDPENGKIIDANEAASRFYGYSIEQLCQMSVYQINTLDPDKITKALKTTQLSSSHFYFKHKLANNSICDVEVYTSPIEWHGKIYSFSIIHDITERKQAEQALEQSKKDFETIINASPDGIAMTDIEGNLIIASDKMAKMYGYEPEDKSLLIGRSIFDFIHPSEHHILHQNFNKLITNQIDEKVTQYLAVKKDKSTFFIEVNYSLINNKEGNPCNILLIERDITQRKQIDEILQRWARIFEYSGWGIVIINADGKTIEIMNPAFAKMHNYNEVELINKTISDIFSADSCSKLIATNELNNQINHQYWESINLKKTGEPIPVLIDSTAVVDSTGKLQYYVINVMDISDRKQAEEKLIESETRLRLAIEGSKVGTWDWNTVTGEVVFGQYWAEILGYQINEIEHKIETLEKLGNPDDMVNVKIALNNHLQNLSPSYESEYRMRTKAGDWKWIMEKGMVVSRDANGNPLRVTGTIVDIDISKRAQIKLEEFNKQLKELDSTKDKLFSIIAHDLKNPISGVLAISGLLVENFKKYDIQKTEKFLEQINNSSKNALNLLENLLYWARSQTGKLAFNPDKFLLLPIVNDTIEVIKSAARIKYIMIETLIDHNLIVIADQNLLQTVIRNLITNAIKFTNPGGYIKIEAMKTDHQLFIFVTDNGVGMTNAQIDKLFSKDKTQITAGTANEKGSGLGLLLCKEFIEMHNGKITVESEPGKGSQFKIFLPQG